MNKTQILVISIILLAVISSLCIVSAADSKVTQKDMLIDSSIKIHYSHPVHSTEYAYYTQGGTYATEAYWSPFSLEASFRFDVKSLYKDRYGDNNPYNLSTFKKDLSKAIKKHQISLAFRGSDAFGMGYNKIPQVISGKNVTASLTDGKKVLKVKTKFKSEEYGTSDRFGFEKDVKKTKKVNVTLGIKYDDFYFKNLKVKKYKNN